MPRHKRGDGFYYKATLPATYADGYFVGWTITCQIRNVKDELIDDAECVWTDPVTTRDIEIRVDNTDEWLTPFDVKVDLQFTRDSDGAKISSNTTFFAIIEDITIP